MKIEMLMPQMGESITEATIFRWHKAVGDKVKKDEMILEISTDKVDSEIPSPEAGTISEILVQEGQTVAVKSLIAVIDTEASGAKPQAPTPKTEVTEKTKQVEAFETVATPRVKPSPVASSGQAPSTKVFSPLVKNIASQHGISLQELEQIEGSGTHGRVTKEDLLFYIEQSEDSTTSAPQNISPTPRAAAAPQADVPARVTAASSAGAGDSIVPFDTMRKAIADHMVRSKQTSPHVYSVAEIDMTAVSKWRKTHREAFKAREGFSLSYIPFFLEAIVKGLTEFPQINASVQDNNFIYKREINLGCAIALGDDGLGGLIVPNIKKSGSLNFNGLARGLNDIVVRARSKKLSPDDVQGGTFTVTNVGSFGNIIGFPIISQPQLAILALGAIKKRPVVVNDAIAIRDICYITLSYDHRAIDGALGGSFLKFITNYLQDWDENRAL